MKFPRIISSCREGAGERRILMSAALLHSKKLSGEVYNPGQKNFFIQAIIFDRMPPIWSNESS